MGKRDMKNKTPPSGAKSQSLVLRLNTRLFFRQLGIFLCMDLLLVVLAAILFGAVYSLLLAVAVCLCLIRKIDRISMAESLKSIE